MTPRRSPSRTRRRNRGSNFLWANRSNRGRPQRSVWIPTQRMETEADEVTRATPVGLWTPDNQMLPQPDVPQTDPARPTVDPPPLITPPPTQSPVQPVAIDEVAPPPRMAPSVTIPEPVDPERIETASPTQLAADHDSGSPTAGRIDGCRIPHAAVGGCRRAIRNR